MQIKLLFSNAISNLEEKTDEFLNSLTHDVINIDIINTVENFEHRYIENIIYDDLDELSADEFDRVQFDKSDTEDFNYSDVHDSSEEDDSNDKSLNKIKIIRANRIQDLELKINSYLNEVKSKIGSFPITDIVHEIKIRQYDGSNCEYRYLAWILHDLVIINACSEIKD